MPTNEVIISNTNALLVTLSPWADQVEYFTNGFSYGLPLALSLAVVWAIIGAVRPTRFPFSKDE